MAFRRFGALGVVLVFAGVLRGQAPIQYEISFPNAAHHEAEVRVTFPAVTQPVLEVVMSRSSPGRYALHEFSKNLYNVRATDAAGRLLNLVRPDPYQWNVTAVGAGSIVFSYTVFGDRVDGTYDAIDLSHAHLNMPATLVWARGFEHVPVTLRFRVPTDSQWKVATQLKDVGGGVWSAPNLGLLMDSPAELSNHQVYSWDAAGQHFRMVLHTTAGSGDTGAKLARMAEAVTLEAAGVFGALPPFDNGTYTFLVDYLPYANSDGMEHRDSTVISGGRALTKDSTPDALESVAHEFFHAWNVERMRPAALEPFDFERVNASGELWFAEGFTNYYGPLVQRRAGLTSLDDLVEGMSRTVNTLLTSPGRETNSAVDMSRQAAFADGATAIDAVNRRNTYVSYYTFGEALALGIDLEMRTRFPGRSLDDWMRAVWQSHGDVDRPYRLDDLEAALAVATGSRTFASDMFARYIQGTQLMDYQALLARVGLLLRKTGPGKISLDLANLRFSNQGAEISTATRRGSPLYEAGLDLGDRLVRVEGKEIRSRDDLDNLVTSKKPGDHTHFTVVGRAGQREVEVAWTESPAIEIVLFEKAGMILPKPTKDLRDEWLRSRTIAPLAGIEASH